MEFKAQGVTYVDEPNKDVVINTAAIDLESQVKVQQRFNSRNVANRYSPNIYIDDGSNGSNLMYTYSYKNYVENNEKPNISNNYANTYKSTLTSNPVYSSVDGLRLHPTGDSGGYSNFTISLTGSGALDISKILEIPFIQEVIACKSAINI